MYGVDATDRRGFLAGAAALGLATAAPLGAATVPEASLERLARAKGLHFGSCMGGGAPHPGEAGGSFRDARYRALAEHHCGLITPENELKWQALRPSPTQYDFRAADMLVDWCRPRGIKVRGHTLLWHREERFPKWLSEYSYGAHPATEAARLLADHVRTVAGRYPGMVPVFDVVNESVDSVTGVPRETTLSRAIGGGVPTIDLAFHTAREAAPDAELVYNDYMSWEPGFAEHRAGVLRLLEGFRKRGVPVDTLGIQSHIGGGPEGHQQPFGAREEREWRAFLDEAVAMGYRLTVTEFDVNDRLVPGDIAQRDKAIADYCRIYFDLMLSYPQTNAIVAWGLVDRYSWLQQFRGRADGSPKRPNPWDDDYRPKPLYDGIAASIRAAQARPA